jgi:hypothetical protein
MSNVLEAGHVYFFYRPRVQQETVQGLADIQRFHIVLGPRDRRLWRLLTVGRKRLPDVSGRERVWAFVDTVGQTSREVLDQLDRQVYGTKTRGERVLPEARPAGQGVYAIVGHETHTHLAYELEFPRRPGEVQEELKIPAQGSYIVTVINPESPLRPFTGVRSQEEAVLPSQLQERFRGRRFAELAPEYLDHPGVELVLIGATTTPEEELGITLAPAEESEEEAAIFKDLELERDQHPLEPLFRGEWR